MRVRLAAEQAARVGQVLLGVDVAGARQLSAFAGDQVFELRIGDGVAYLKLAMDREAHRDIPREVAVLDFVRARGVPVPAVVACDQGGAVAGVPSVVLADVGGDPLTGTEPVFRQVGAHLRRLHDNVAIGFGAVDAANGLVGDDATWRQTLEGPAVALLPAVEAGLVDAGLLTRAKSAIDRFGPVLDGLECARLIHGDFTPRHVYADGSRITGIIDWGDAMAGDPAYDFGRLLHSGILNGGIELGRSLVAAALSSYGDPPWLSDPLDLNILFYAAMFVLSSMGAEFSAGAPWPPWWPANAAALTTILDALDSGPTGSAGRDAG
jgi:Ser/Thr protein kinase RdoA (MazF antagonist)